MAGIHRIACVDIAYSSVVDFPPIETLVVRAAIAITWLLEVLSYLGARGLLATGS